MIYLATPYTHADPAVMEARFDVACRVAGALMAEGKAIYSPIAATHPIAVRCELPRDWNYWANYDREMISACRGMIVLQMDGWDCSKGVAAEVEIARELGIPVEYMEVPGV